RDSNPRNLSVQRFSRPPQSITLPSLQELFLRVLPFKSDAKIRLYFKYANSFRTKTEKKLFFCSEAPSIDPREEGSGVFSLFL
ncbi:MAG: hypothetical protein ACRCZY_00490, partial [Phocaeicola sp.]